ncbi:MAG: tRNA (adenosine(37)-N6)-dimethylallyltransferase MiaA [Alphaproteobacteria bacterium]
MNKIIAVIGPTASGKSHLALKLAQKLGGEIINFDSMQVYKGLDVITACPSAAEKALIPHHLYQFQEPDTSLNTAAWAALAKDAITDCFHRGKQPILVGGTGFYLKTLIEGISPIPDTNPAIVAQLMEEAAVEGTPALHKRLAQVDPAIARTLKPQDTQRIIRALSVFMDTETPLSAWQRIAPTPYLPSATWQILGLLPERSALYARCDKRFDTIMAQGALAETQALKDKNLPTTLPAMRSVGVKQLMAYLNGEWDLETATEKAKIATRNYAKRQSTWVRNQITGAIILPQFGEEVQIEELKL